MAEAVKKEQTEGETVSLDNMKDLKGKKGANLIVKILAMVLMPMLVIIFFAMLALKAVGNNTAETLVKEELAATEYAMQLNLDSASGEGFRYENGSLCKGEINFTENQSFFQNFTSNTNVDVVLFWDKEAAAASFDYSGIVLSDSVASKVLSGSEYFDTSLKLGDTRYYAYLTPITGTDGKTAGALAVAIPVEHVKELYSGIVRSNTIFMYVLALIFCISTILVVRLISRALLGVVSNLDQVAEGRLNFDISTKLVNRTDEVGKIARAVHSVVVGFSRIITNIHSSMQEMDEFTGTFSSNFDSIGQSISAVNTAVNEIAQGATTQAADTQKVSESMNDMSNALNRTADSVNVLSSSAANMKESNATVDSTLKELLKISSHTQQSVDQVQEQTNITNESAQAIQAATDIIAGIANQTNLLSLNASIEAARAGEQGKGFGVVASEIQKLAEQTNESATHIEEIVQELLRDAEKAVETMYGVKEIMHTQSDHVEQTESAFEQVQSGVEQSIEGINRISEHTTRLNDAREKVVGIVQNLTSIAEANAAGTEQTSASTTEVGAIMEDISGKSTAMRQAAQELDDGMNIFKL